MHRELLLGYPSQNGYYENIIFDFFHYKSFNLEKLSLQMSQCGAHIVDCTGRLQITHEEKNYQGTNEGMHDEDCLILVYSS